MKNLTHKTKASDGRCRINITVNVTLNTTGTTENVGTSQCHFFLVEAKYFVFRTYIYTYIRIYYTIICNAFQYLAGVGCSTLSHFYSQRSNFADFDDTCVKLWQIWWSLLRRNAQIEFALAARGDDQLAADPWIFLLS